MATALQLECMGEGIKGLQRLKEGLLCNEHVYLLAGAVFKLGGRLIVYL